MFNTCFEILLEPFILLLQLFVVFVVSLVQLFQLLCSLLLVFYDTTHLNINYN